MAASLCPEFVRNVDYKCRVALPACVCEAFTDAARTSLLPDGLLFVEPAMEGRTLHRPDGRSRTLRIIIPPEFRQRTRIRPGAEVAIARNGRGLLIWALEG